MSGMPCVLLGKTVAHFWTTILQQTLSVLAPKDLGGGWGWLDLLTPLCLYDVCLQKASLMEGCFYTSPYTATSDLPKTLSPQELAKVSQCL